MTKEEIAKRFCKFELCTHRNGEGMCCLYNQDNCSFHRLEKENTELKERLAETNLNGNIVLRELTKANLLLKDVYKIAMEDWNDPKWHDQVLRKAREYLKEIKE